jgi:hypothetical protein
MNTTTVRTQGSCGCLSEARVSDYKSKFLKHRGNIQRENVFSVTVPEMKYNPSFSAATLASSE